MPLIMYMYAQHKGSDKLSPIIIAFNNYGTVLIIVKSGDNCTAQPDCIKIYILYYHFRKYFCITAMYVILCDIKQEKKEVILCCK